MHQSRISRSLPPHALEHGRLPKAAAALGATVAVLAGLAVAAPAGASINYPMAATLTTTGPTLFSAPASDQPVANLSLDETVAGGIPTGYVCLSPAIGSFAGGSSQVPTVVGTNGITVGDVSVTGSGDLSFDVTAASTTSAGSITMSNLHASIPSSGRADLTVRDGLSSPCASSGGNTLTSVAAGWAFETFTQDTYGQSAVDTTAEEYSSQFACNGVTGVVQHTAVLASSAEPLEALAAAPLAGALHAGLLVTAPGSLDPAVSTALRQDGVTTVYVVGDPSAISPSILQALGATQATQCENGVPATTGHDVKVVGPVGGTTLDATASAIDTESNAVAPFGSVQPAIDLSGVRSNTYNDTTGNSSASGQSAAAGKTAVLVMNEDFQDSMTASGMLYAEHLPIVLTPGASLGTSARSTLQSLGITQVIVLGGQLAVQPAVVDKLMALGMTVVRLAGEDGTDTAGMIARFEDAEATGTGLAWVPKDPGWALLAQGASPSDALGAAALSGESEESIFLTKSPKSGLGAYTPQVLADAGSATGLGDAAHPAPISHLQVLGGPLAVPRSQIEAALLALAGAAG